MLWGSSKMRKTTIAAIAAAVTAAASLSAAPAMAQQAFTGMWNCQSTYTELNQQGGRTSGWSKQYQIIFNSNYTYQAQGQMAAANGYSQFRSQGNWQYQGNAIMARGPEQSSDGTGLMFMFSATLQGGQLTMRYEQPDPTGSWVMNRSLTQCQRAQ